MRYFLRLKPRCLRSRATGATFCIESDNPNSARKRFQIAWCYYKCHEQSLHIKMVPFSSLLILKFIFLHNTGTVSSFWIFRNRSVRTGIRWLFYNFYSQYYVNGAYIFLFAKLFSLSFNINYQNKFLDRRKGHMRI